MWVRSPLYLVYRLSLSTCRTSPSLQANALPSFRREGLLLDGDGDVGGFDVAVRILLVVGELRLDDELLGDELEKEMEKRGLPRVKFGTGVNTGTCIVGNMGAETRLDYSVVGDAVNLGARLEAQTRAEDTPIIVSEYTYLQCSDIAFSNIGEVTVKGKEEPVRMYAPLFDGEVRKLYK